MSHANNASTTQLTDKAVRFVSLQHAFHPENAESILTTAYAVSDQDVADNKWGAVWSEATIMLSAEDMPCEPVEVFIDEETSTLTMSETTAPTNDAVDSDGQLYVPNDALTRRKDDNSNTSSVFVKHMPCCVWNLFEVLFGVSLAIPAVASTLGIEVAAAIVYILAVVFDRIAVHLCCWLWICDILFRLLSLLLLLIDSILLVTSVFVTELLAVVAFVLTTLAGGFQRGAHWHQYIRKICILSRWAFRDFHKGWKPKRVFALAVDGRLAEVAALSKAASK